MCSHAIIGMQVNTNKQLWILPYLPLLERAACGIGKNHSKGRIVHSMIHARAGLHESPLKTVGQCGFLPYQITALIQADSPSHLLGRWKQRDLRKLNMCKMNFGQGAVDQGQQQDFGLCWHIKTAGDAPWKPSMTPAPSLPPLPPSKGILVGLPLKMAFVNNNLWGFSLELLSRWHGGRGWIWLLDLTKASDGPYCM